MKFALKIGGRQRTFNLGADAATNGKKAVELFMLGVVPAVVVAAAAYTVVKLRG